MNGIPPGTAFDDLPPGGSARCATPRNRSSTNWSSPGPPCAHEEGAAHLRRRRGTVIYDRGVHQHLLRRAVPHDRTILQIHRDYVEAGRGDRDEHLRSQTPIRLKPYGLAEKTEANQPRRRPAGEGGGGVGNLRRGVVGPCTESRQRMPTLSSPSRRRSGPDGALAAEGWTCSPRDLLQPERTPARARVGKEFGKPVLASFVSTTGGDALGCARRRWRRPSPATERRHRRDQLRHGTSAPSTRSRRSSDTGKPVVVIAERGDAPGDQRARDVPDEPGILHRVRQEVIELGSVRGGCCGTTPAHIRMAARA